MPTGDVTAGDVDSANTVPHRRLPWFRIVAAAAIVTALAGGGLLAWRLLADQGGAASPEEAVTGLIQSVADQDGVGALRMLAPGEVDGIDDVYGTVQKRLAKEHLVSSEDGVVMKALDIQVSHLRVDVDQLGDNGARVYLNDGDVTVHLDPSKLGDRYTALATRFPKGKTWTYSARDLFDGFQVGREDRPFLTTVRLDGRWYVSAVATAGEYGIEKLDLEHADYDALSKKALEPDTAKDPEDAVSNLLDAISSADPDRVLRSLPDKEFATVRPFVDVISSAVGQYGAEVNVERSGNLDTDFDVQGSLGKLTIHRAAVQASASANGEGGSGDLAIDNDCFEANGDRTCMNSHVRKLTGIDSYWLMLRKADSGWQVDPMATLVSYAKKVTETVPEPVALEFLGLEGLIKPTATLTPGTSQKVATDAAGTVMVQVAAKKGDVIAPAVEGFGEDHYYQIYGPGDLESPTSWGDSVIADEAGNYRILITSDRFGEQDVTVEADVLTPKPATSTTGLAPFAGQKAGAYTVNLDGTYEIADDVTYTLLDKHGDSVYLYAGDELTGTYTLVVYGPVDLKKVTAGFNSGQARYSGTAGPSATVSVPVNLVGGKGYAISCSSDADISLAIEALDVTADAELGFSTETLNVSTDTSGNYTLDVFNFGDSATSFDCTIT